MKKDSDSPCHPIKIAHLITDLDTGGAEMMLAKLVASMDSEGFSNIVISLTDHGTLGEQIADLGVPVFTLGMKRGLPDPGGMGRLMRILKQEKPDILQTWLYHADLLGTLTSRLISVPALCWNIRCSDMDMRRYSWLSRLVLQLLAWLSPLPDVIIANSETGRQLHEKLGYNARRWEIIHNGFDVGRFQPDPAARQSVRQELSLAPDTPLIGMVARYDPMKDHQTFLAAAAQVVREYSDVHCVLIGKGVDRLAETVADLGLEAFIRLLGERGDIPRLMAALDILVLSSAFGEGFPNVVGEAMACGIPCVVTHVGDGAYVVGETGLVVPPRDPTAMADAWKHLLEMPIDQRQALGKKGRQRVKQFFSIKNIGKCYESLYRGIGRELQNS